LFSWFIVATLKGYQPDAVRIDLVKNQ